MIQKLKKNIAIYEQNNKYYLCNALLILLKNYKIHRFFLYQNFSLRL
jgi:hypothetical protein